MGTYYTKKETNTSIDAEGNMTTTEKETKTSYARSEEPDYIKLYTKMWCEFNAIPNVYRNFFMELAMRMSYANANDLQNSQIVYTGGSVKKAIQNTLGWKDAMYYKALKDLCECGALTKVSRSEYQINPQYAAKGSWKYNPKLKNGGVEDLVATFNFKDKTVDTKIIWADDTEKTEINEMYRAGMNVKPEQETILKQITIRASQSDEEELNIDGLTNQEANLFEAR